MLSEKELQNYGIKSASVIAEGIFRPRIIIIHFDDSEYIYDFNNRITLDLLDEIINNHINNVCIRQIRKKKLESLNENR